MNNNNTIIIGKFVSKKKSFLIAIGISLTLWIFIKPYFKKYCENKKKEDIKGYCKKFFSSKFINMLIIYLIFKYSFQFIYNIHDKIINREAYVTLDWFSKYVKKMAKYNIDDFNFNIHAKV